MKIVIGILLSVCFALLYRSPQFVNCQNRAYRTNHTLGCIKAVTMCGSNRKNEYKQWIITYLSAIVTRATQANAQRPMKIYGNLLRNARSHTAKALCTGDIPKCTVILSQG